MNEDYDPEVITTGAQQLSNIWGVARSYIRQNDRRDTLSPADSVQLSYRIQFLHRSTISNAFSIPLNHHGGSPLLAPASSEPADWMLTHLSLSETVTPVFEIRIQRKENMPEETINVLDKPTYKVIHGMIIKHLEEEITPEVVEAGTTQIVLPKEHSSLDSDVLLQLMDDAFQTTDCAWKIAALGRPQPLTPDGGFNLTIEAASLEDI